MLFAPWKPKATVFTVLFASKKRGIYSVFWPVPSKNTGIYAVFSMLQEMLLPCRKHKKSVESGFVEGAEGRRGGRRY